MDKAKIVKIGEFTPEGVGHGWVFDCGGKPIPGIYIPFPANSAGVKASVSEAEGKLLLDVDASPEGRPDILYAGYTLAELKEIASQKNASYIDIDFEYPEATQ